ncbi:MAG: hypothetical protein RIC29_14950 [Rhodospirillaceae bacterium]
MKAAQMLVWVMSGMLIALLALLVVGLSLGWHIDDDFVVATPQETLSEKFSLTLQQPAGTMIGNVSEVNGLAAVSLSGGGIGPRVLFLNLTTGAVVGDLTLEFSD